MPRNALACSPNDTARSNSGSNSRQLWQRPSPTSNCGGSRRSPHCTHCGPRMGSIESRHFSQTGSREMFVRGRLQILQSEGNATEKTLRTTVDNGATRKKRCSARCIRRCRSRVARLLKTTLQSMVPARDTPVRRPSEGTEGFSIVTSQKWCNAGSGSPAVIHRVFIERLAAVETRTGLDSRPVLVRSAIAVLTCAVTGIWARRKAFAYE